MIVGGVCLGRSLRTARNLRRHSMRNTGIKLHSAIENGAGQIRSWLLAMDLDGFNPHNAPAVTEAKMGMIRASRSSAAENIEMVMGCSYGVTEGVILTSSTGQGAEGVWLPCAGGPGDDQGNV
jgi:hypothetical protein